MKVDFGQFCESPGGLDQLGRLVTEYEILGHIRAAIRSALQVDLLRGGAQHWLDRVSFMFDSFGRHVERMMCIEESDGHLGEGHFHPAAAPRLEQLRADHVRIRSDVARLGTHVHRANPADVNGLVRLRDELLRILREMETHEEHELRVIREVFWRDVRGERRT